MKITVVNVVMFSVGAILVYSGIKGYDPRAVIKWGLGGKKPKPIGKVPGAELGDNSKNPDPGQRYPGDVGIPDPSHDGDVSA